VTGQRRIGVREVLNDPLAVAEHLTSTMWGTDVRVAHDDGNFVVFEVTFAPLAALADEGYSPETARISIWSTGRIVAIPTGARRTWKHRQPYAGDVFESLCLWYPNDPRGLRWDWTDGLEEYFAIVRRHLLSEEWARRNGGRWPVEDAPHGRGPHPITTPQMASAAGRYRR
jgi:hypothetical protein